MTKHIGIVGCSAEGAALCYRTICLEAEPLMGKYAHPEITMHTIALAEYMKPIDAGAGWQPVAELMLHSADALKRAGADFLTVRTTPCMKLCRMFCHDHRCRGCTLRTRSARKQNVAASKSWELPEQSFW